MFLKFLVSFVGLTKSGHFLLDKYSHWEQCECWDYWRHLAQRKSMGIGIAGDHVRSEHSGNDMTKCCNSRRYWNQWECYDCNMHCEYTRNRL